MEHEFTEEELSKKSVSELKLILDRETNNALSQLTEMSKPLIEEINKMPVLLRTLELINVLQKSEVLATNILGEESLNIHRLLCIAFIDAGADARHGNVCIRLSHKQKIIKMESIPKEVVVELLQYVQFTTEPNRNLEITEKIADEEFVTIKQLLDRIEYSILNSRYKVDFMKLRLQLPEYNLFKQYFKPKTQRDETSYVD